jgi:glycosyltransferase involved in cell wall biosynthesis
MTQDILVFASPLPDMRNGIADYAGAILRQLAARYDCVAVVDRPEDVSADIRRIAQVISVEEYWRAADVLRGERHLYQLGNNPDHVYVIDMASEVPGVVVLHDLTLLYLMEHWAEYRLGQPDRLVETAKLLGGASAEALLTFKFAGNAPLGSVHTEVNCVALLNGACTGLVTHSQLGAITARAAGFGGAIDVIPHFATVPRSAEKKRQRRAWRRRWQVGPDTVVFASLGFVTRNKCIKLALEALAQLPPEVGDWCYVIAGEDRDPAVRATCARLKLNDRVIFMDYLPEDDFDGVLSAADMLINLRFPTSGETSGTVCRALAHALPCIVSDHGWYGELPDGVTYKLRPDRKATDELRALLVMGMLDSESRKSKERAALDYARRHLALDRIVEQYVDAIEAAHNNPAPDRASRKQDAGLIFQPEQRSVDSIDVADAEGTLCEILQGEHVTADGKGARRSWDRRDPHLAGLWPGQEPEPPALGAARQLFGTVDDSGLPGRILLRVHDDASQLETGDFLTLAVISDGAAAASARHAHPPGLVLPPVDRPGRILDEALRAAGMTVLRHSEIRLTLPGPYMAEGDRLRRVIICTARRDSLAVPQLAYLRTALSVSSDNSTPQEARP